VTQIHLRKDEGALLLVFLNEAIEVGLVPLTLGAVLLGEHEDETLVGAGGRVLSLLDDRDEVGAKDLQDTILSELQGGVSRLRVQIGLEAVALEILDELVYGICSLNQRAVLSLTNDDVLVEVARVHVLQDDEPEVAIGVEGV
jgi:hypothetical protein